MEHPLGTIVINEIIYPISSITLEEGCIKLHACLVGPAEIRPGTSIVVFGSDGQLVVRGASEDNAATYIGDPFPGNPVHVHFTYSVAFTDRMTDTVRERLKNES